MNTLAFKSIFPFEPKAPVPVDAVTVDAYTTTAGFRETLGPLSYLAYKPATFRVLVRAPEANGAGEITVKLTDGTTDLASVPVNLAAAQVTTVAVDVDLSGVSGAAQLRTIVDVGTAADVSTEVTVDTKLEVEQPLVLSGCA